MIRTAALALALLAFLAAAAATASARPALPPPPVEVRAVHLGDGAYQLSWSQQSTAPRVLVNAGTFSAALAGAPAHTVIVPASAGWSPALPVTIAEDWPGEDPLAGEVYILPAQTFTYSLPALAR